MTDGLHAESRMLGDVKFHQHRGVDAERGGALAGGLRRRTSWASRRWELGAGARLRASSAAAAAGRRSSRGAGARASRCRSPSPRSGSGSSTSSSRERRPTTSRRRPARGAARRRRRCAGAPRRDRRAATRRCAPPSPRRDGRAGAGRRGRPPRSPLPLVDLSGLPAAPREAEARAARRERGRAGRSTSRAGRSCAPPCCGWRRAEHAVAARPCTTSSPTAGRWGCWSRELAALYGAFAPGRPSPLPELPIQYADFAALAAAAGSRGEVLEAQLAYWRERLAGRAGRCELPADRPRPAVQSYRGARSAVRPAAPGSRPRCARSAGGEGATLFMVLLAAFAGAPRALHRPGGPRRRLAGRRPRPRARSRG